MLSRSNKSQRIIEMNTQLRIQLQNEIDALQEKLAKLDNQFKIKNKNFSIVSFFFKE
jgi:aspartate ammonia-lyase